MKARIATLIASATLAFAAASAHAEVIVSNYDKATYDRSSGSVVFDVTSHERITDLNVAVDFMKCDNTDIEGQTDTCLSDGKPFENEIVIRLIGPDGREISLVSAGTFVEGDTGGIGRIVMTFDDEGQPLGRRVQAGAFRPVESLGVFDGMDMFGQWTLYFQDTELADPFIVFASHLIFNAPDAPADVPEPGSAALVGAGLLGLAALRRRRKQ